MATSHALETIKFNKLVMCMSEFRPHVGNFAHFENPVVVEKMHSCKLNHLHCFLKRELSSENKQISKIQHSKNQWRILKIMASLRSNSMIYAIPNKKV